MYSLLTSRRRRLGLGSLLVALGALLVVATFAFPIGSTMAACGSGVTTWSPVPGLSLPVVNPTGLGLADLALYWSDGCNGIASSLVPVFLAVGCLVGAAKVISN
ncbi:hypothetical protein SAMN04487948_12276 [Halogranum amylolyticum]|uniref:Uncharacterized protein n=1 Tax=Halogranum amylolyticum TaxID=660520 RepID=A0A1H8W4K3_9EURY|nr:hypothetical protein [Halogranum amylolyticum]SEP22088.1 hypothetical protein SAMN04487948_12276 [Halogranum amylolyticum]